MFSLMSACGFVGVIISDDGIKESSGSFFLSEIRLRKLVDEREKMIEQVFTVLEPLQKVYWEGFV